MTNCADSITAIEPCRGTSCHESIDCKAELQWQKTASSTSDVSTACSETDEHNTAVDDWLDMDSYSSNLVCEQSTHHIYELVESECGFLRLRGHSIHAEVTRKKPRRGIAGTLRIYMEGLPRVKRAKWYQPLCWSVMAMLQRCGCTMRMQNGELYVQAREGIVLRLDFAATRV